MLNFIFNTTGLYQKLQCFTSYEKQKYFFHLIKFLSKSKSKWIRIFFGRRLKCWYSTFSGWLKALIKRLIVVSSLSYRT